MDGGPQDLGVDDLLSQLIAGTVGVEAMARFSGKYWRNMESIHFRALLRIFPIAIALLSGCKSKGNTAQALSEVLAAVDHEARETSVEEYEEDLRGGVPRARTFQVPCDSPAGLTVRVTSPGEWDEILTTIPSRQQTWEMDIDCTVGDSRKVRGELLIDKTFDASAEFGTARIEGHLKAARGRDCDVDVVLEFDTATGKGSVTQGEVCGKDASEFSESWRVPGFTGEHLVGEY